MEQRAHRGAGARAGANVAAGMIVLAMVVVALAMWTVVPLGWVWLASQISGQDPSMGPYMLILVGIISSIVLLAWLLGRLNRVYIRITGTHTISPIRPAWLKSMRDERSNVGAPTVMETVIVASVVLAVIAMTLWFFILAGSPIPNR